MKNCKIKIHDYEWEIEFVKNEASCGVTDYNNLVITIWCNQKDQVVRHSIIHELTHAYRWSYGYQNDEDNKKLTCDQIEEEVANFMETWGSEVLSTSNDLFDRYLKSKGTKKNGKK